MEGGFQYEGGMPVQVNENDQTKHVATEVEPLNTEIDVEKSSP